MLKKRPRSFTSNLIIKTLLLLCVPILLAEAQPQKEDNGMKLNKTLKEKWMPATNIVAGISDSPAKVKVRKAVYSVHFSNKDADFPAIAFEDPGTGKIWFGRENDFYVTTTLGIIGGTLDRGGAVIWDRGFITPKSGENLDDVVARFEKEASGSVFLDAAEPIPRSDLSNALERGFFTRGPADSGTVQCKITSAETEKGKVHLELENPATHRRASVWIDQKTLKPTKGIVQNK
jgi:hypothetical protein